MSTMDMEIHEDWFVNTQDVPCRYCGEADVRVINQKTGKPVTGSELAHAYQVECYNCGSRGPAHYRPCLARLGWLKGERGSEVIRYEPGATSPEKRRA